MQAKSCFLLFAAAPLLLACGANCWASDLSLPLKAGIIGMDAHALSWTKIINDSQASGELADRYTQKMSSSPSRPLRRSTADLPGSKIFHIYPENLLNKLF